MINQLTVVSVIFVIAEWFNYFCLELPSTYLFDSTSGFYYDTTTGLYYDPNTQVNVIVYFNLPLLSLCVYIVSL